MPNVLPLTLPAVKLSHTLQLTLYAAPLLTGSPCARILSLLNDTAVLPTKSSVINTAQLLVPS